MRHAVRRACPGTRTARTPSPNLARPTRTVLPVGNIRRDMIGVPDLCEVNGRRRGPAQDYALAVRYARIRTWLMYSRFSSTVLGRTPKSIRQAISSMPNVSRCLAIFTPRSTVPNMPWVSKKRSKPPSTRNAMSESCIVAGSNLTSCDATLLKNRWNEP